MSACAGTQAEKDRAILSYNIERKVNHSKNTYGAGADNDYTH